MPSYTALAARSYLNQGGARYQRDQRTLKNREAARFSPVLLIGIPTRGCRRTAATLPAVEAAQEDSPLLLLLAINSLHPRVQRLCMEIIGGATLEEAARLSGLSKFHVQTVLPPLRRFLTEHLGLYP